jgi:SAM-dependent methyltransferase
MSETIRLESRKLNIWKRDFLVYKYLWPAIEKTVKQILDDIEQSEPVVLDVGCGNKPYIDLFGNCKYIGVDRNCEGATPDVIGTADSIPFDDCFADIVFSTQVIEHVPDHHAMLKECYRVLKPGGIIILTGPFCWPLHEEPYDFYRFSKYGFNTIFSKAGFTEIQITPDSGDWAQIFQSINLNLPVKRVMIPFVGMFNVIGVILDKLDYSNKSPLNYIVTAKK